MAISSGAAVSGLDAMRDSGRMGSRRSGLSGRSSRNWGIGPDNVFGRASGSRMEENEIDDEEALKWAALEKLPTYDRMRTTILESMKGSKVHREHVDLRTVSQEKLRRELIAKLFNDSNPDDDNYKFLVKLRERIDRVGIALPTVEVRYQDLSIDAKVHVGGRALPTLWNSAVNAIEGGLGAMGIRFVRKQDISILHEVSGIIKPGRMTLLLGPPSSGKTSLLLALASKLDPTLKVKGEITYNGHTLKEFVPQKTSAYVSQYDLLVGEMTVRETLEFSAKCQGVGTRYELLTELTKREKELGIHPEADVDYYMKAAAMKETSSGLITDYMLKILGLDICADTIVGDDMRRGISGGQKKRTTTGEVIVGPVKTLFMDEISTGLDSSTTFQIIKCLGDITHMLESTILISLLQPAPETYDLFDDVILLSEGQVTYHGPRENILEFFESLGFKCPERKGVADFLQEVTSRKDQEQYWADKSQPYQFIPSRDFAAAFKNFRVGAKIMEELNTPYDKAQSHKAALSYEKYSITPWELFKVNWDKEWLLMKRNSFVYVFKTTQIAIMALVAMTVYLRTNMHRRNLADAQVFGGALFFGVLNIMFNGYAELSMTIIRLPVYFKQREMLFFPAWAFSIATTVLRIPLSIVETLIFIVITYYTIGFAPAASRFFKQLFLYFWVHQMSAALFRMMAGLCRSMIVANTGGTFSLLVIFVLGGFLIPRKQVKPWWIWGYWISPLSYAFNGINVNEFLAPQWDKPYGNSSLPLGVQYLNSVSIFPYEYWYWIAVAVMVGYTILFNVLFTFTLTYLGPIGNPQAVISDEQRAEMHANRTGEALPSPTPTRKSMSSTRRSPSFSKRGSLSSTKSIQRKSGLFGTDVRDSGGDLALARVSGLNGTKEGHESPMARASSLSSRGRNSLEIEYTNGVAPKQGMILPFQPLSISFDNVQYFVDMPAQMKAQGAVEDKLQLLNGITGAFRPGILTALVGVSGAGKTTLMDVLAGRKTGGYIEGDIRISGYPKVQETFARISGYCEQNDIHSPQVTVHESLIYSAWLRLPHEIDSETKVQFVQEVMDLVELNSLRDALVGLPGVSGLSTEQRKRLTIAVELVANPSIIFMDEPTSGLDARAAAIVMRTVRNTVDTGRTVVCTIHQPSIDIFEAFDELLLLKRGGQVIYAGPLGRHSHKLVEFFSAVPGVPKIKEGYNPATWMLEVTSVGVEQRLGVDFADIYRKSSLFQRNQNLVNDLKTPAPDSKDLWFPTQYSQPFFSQVSSCLWKQHKTYWRSPDYNNVRMFFTAIAALLFGTVFWQLGPKRDSQENIFSIMAAMYAAVIFIGVNNSVTVQPVVEIERTVFYRERAAGMYSAGPYAMGQVLIEIPYCCFQVVLYSVITYSMIGLEWTAAKFFWYIYFMLFTFFYFTFYGMMSVGLTPNHHISAITSSFFYQFWNLFSGFLITRKRIPKWWAWYYWACPVAWTLYGLIVSQFGDVDTPLTLTDKTQKPTTVAQFVDSNFGFKHSFLPVVAVMHLVFPVLFAIIFMFTIKYLNFQHR
ncbi:unnamed protein product [Calypogeia fissa]